MTDEMRAAIAALSRPPSPGGKAVTSNLTIDESLLLHGAGYEPLDLVTGVSVQAIPYGSFLTPYGQTAPLEIPAADAAVMEAFRLAVDRLCHECAGAGGVGVVGVVVSFEVGGNEVRVTLHGTAIGPIRSPHAPLGRPFATDLSARDFVLLERAGWAPLDLVYGAGFVVSPLKGLRQVLGQVTQNVELVQLTQALQRAREQAMERMQHLALGARASGIVDVTILDGPLHRSRHVLAFVCYGTAVRLAAEGHRPIEPTLVLSLDDNVGFEASAVRTRGE